MEYSKLVLFTRLFLKFFPIKRLRDTCLARSMASDILHCHLTRVRAACEQAERIEKIKKKIASSTSTTRKKEIHVTFAMFWLRDTEIPRMLSIFGKRCLVFDGRDEGRGRGKGVVQRRGNYQERSVGVRRRGLRER